MQFAKLTIDATEYTLAYDFNEICKAEEFTGTNLLAGLENLASMTAGQLRGLFWAALESGPESAFPGKSRQESLELSGALIRLDTLEAITKQLASAYSLSLPATEEEQAVAAA